jgi:hypothetical protein
MRPFEYSSHSLESTAHSLRRSAANPPPMRHCVEHGSRGRAVAAPGHTMAALGHIVAATQ